MKSPETLPPFLVEVLREQLGANVASAQKMRGGHCNSLWKVATPSGPVAVRLGAASGLELGADRHAEVAAIRAAFPVAPTLLMADTESGWLVTEWIPGRHWSREEAAEPVNLVRMAAAFAGIHASPVSTGIRRLDMRATLIRLGGRLGDEVETFLAVLEPEAAHGLCHNDPHHQNILVGDGARIRMVDWEYAAVGECAADLAEYANAHELDAAGAGVLLDAYLEAGGQVSSNQLGAARWLCRLRNSLWDSEIQRINK